MRHVSRSAICAIRANMTEKSEELTLNGIRKSGPTWPLSFLRTLSVFTIQLTYRSRIEIVWVHSEERLNACRCRGFLWSRGTSPALPKSTLRELPVVVLGSLDLSPLGQPVGDGRGRQTGLSKDDR